MKLRMDGARGLIAEPLGSWGGVCGIPGLKIETGGTRQFTFPAGSVVKIEVLLS